VPFPLLLPGRFQKICSSGPEINFAVSVRSTTAYSKGENYAEKCNSAFGCDGFDGFRKFDAGVCGEQPNARSLATDT
jgi:hypothetical protein